MLVTIGCGVGLLLVAVGYVVLLREPKKRNGYEMCMRAQTILHVLPKPTARLWFLFFIKVLLPFWM